MLRKGAADAGDAGKTPNRRQKPKELIAHSLCKLAATLTHINTAQWHKPALAARNRSCLISLGRRFDSFFGKLSELSFRCATDRLTLAWRLAKQAVS